MEEAPRGQPMESFDARHTITPLFLLQVTNAFGRIRSGEKVEITADDPGITTELKRILSGRKHELRVVEQKSEADGDFKLWLIKTPHKPQERKQSWPKD